MSFDRAAYMRRWRKERREKGLCPQCGGPNPRKTAKCDDCAAGNEYRNKDMRRYARLGRAIYPQLRESVRTGQPVFLSPADSLKLVKILDAPQP